MSASESVTARLTLRRMASGGSSREMKVSSGSDLLILRVGSCRLMMRLPTLPKYPSGTVNTSP